MQYYFNLKRKYENNLNYCFAIYEVNHSGIITLIDSNITFRKFFKISSHAYKHKRLEDLAVPSISQHLIERIIRFITSHKTHCFVRQSLYPGNNVLWESSITIKYSRNIIKVYEISQKIMNLTQSPVAKLQHKSIQALCSGLFDITLLLNILSNRIIIENINKNLQHILDLPFQEIIGKPIEAFPMMDSIRSRILECVKTRKVITLVEQFRKNEELQYWQLSLTPLFHTDSTQLLIYAQNITDSILCHQKIEDLTDELNFCLQKTPHALCIYYVNDDHQITIERENLAFIELQEELKRSGQILLPKDTLKQVLEKPEPYIENLYFKKADGKIVYYQLRILPFLKDNKITKIFLSCSPMSEAPITKKTSKQQSALTNREQEILKLILDGCTNKYISVILNISEGTVKKIVYNLYKKLNVSSRVEIIKLFFKVNN